MYRKVPKKQIFTTRSRRENNMLKTENNMLKTENDRLRNKIKKMTDTVEITRKLGVEVICERNSAIKTSRKRKRSMDEKDKTLKENESTMSRIKKRLLDVEHSKSIEMKLNVFKTETIQELRDRIDELISENSELKKTIEEKGSRFPRYGVNY